MDGAALGAHHAPSGPLHGIDLGGLTTGQGVLASALGPGGDDGGGDHGGEIYAAPTAHKPDAAFLQLTRPDLGKQMI